MSRCRRHILAASWVGSLLLCLTGAPPAQAQVVQIIVEGGIKLATSSRERTLEGDEDSVDPATIAPAGMFEVKLSNGQKGATNHVQTSAAGCGPVGTSAYVRCLLAQLSEAGQRAATEAVVPRNSTSGEHSQLLASVFANGLQVIDIGRMDVRDAIVAAGKVEIESNHLVLEFRASKVSREMIHVTVSSPSDKLPQAEWELLPHPARNLILDHWIGRRIDGESMDVVVMRLRGSFAMQWRRMAVSTWLHDIPLPPVTNVPPAAFAKNEN